MEMEPRPEPPQQEEEVEPLVEATNEPATTASNLLKN